MQDADLLVQLAGIAGVFVGFGALISVRGGGASGAHEVAYIGWVVSIAIWVVIAALAPVIISRYGIAGHELWLAGSLLALVLFVVMITMNGSAPEMSEDRALVRASRPPMLLAAVAAVSTMWLPTAGLVLALALVVLGLFRDQESALYLTAVGLGLYMGAIGLFVMVFSRGRLQAA
jgi:hypothetical protein